MRRLLLSAAAVVVSLSLAATAGAGPKGGNAHHSGSHAGSSHGGSSHGGNYHMTHGSRMKNGSYYYKGKNHSHWTHRYWWGKYGCYAYYCPSTGGWYYWYAPDDCYYPVSYIATATPVAVVPPAGVTGGVTQIIIVTNGSPAGAVPAPPDSPGP
jgi:hypothetical protein